MTLTVYWSPLHINQPTPVSLFKEVSAQKATPLQEKSFFSCPAVSRRLKNTFVFRAPDTTANLFSIRPSILESAPTMTYQNSHLFFSETSIKASFTAPYFHPPKHTNYGAVIPGAFNIGTWFRPYNCEFQLWDASNPVSLEPQEPIFYIELLTDEPVVLQKFRLSPTLIEYVKLCKEAATSDGERLSLSDRYSSFEDKGFGPLILKEIQKNLINDNMPSLVL